jgi:membrane associated rhomboid family serine protease
LASETRSSQGYVHTIRQELVGVGLFILVIWGVFLVTHLSPGNLTNRLALVPRYWTRLPGIVTMPFLHKDLAHLVSNSIPLFVLLTLLAGSRARSSVIVAGIGLLSGGLLWLLGRNGTPSQPISHIGASALVFGLVTFHVTAGILERRPISILIAIVVGFLYGGMLLWELFLPFLSTNDRVSWEGHVMGALAGIAVAFHWTGQSVQAVQEAVPSLGRMAARARQWWKLLAVDKNNTSAPNRARRSDRSLPGE